jgi:predicted dithiol-disulfide oxidoreductase (DUF899 family)
VPITAQPHLLLWNHKSPHSIFPQIFHTYSTYARGLDLLVGAYNYLDLTPKGRNEEEIMEWVRHHDRYEEQASAGCCHGG